MAVSTTKRHSSRARGVAMGTLLAFLFAQPTAALGNAAALQGLSSLGYLGTAAASNTAGLTSIANGTANQQQGESTQNMAQAAMGAMQIAMGLLGLLAALAAQKKSNTSDDRRSDLSSYTPPSAGTSPTPASPGSTEIAKSQLGNITASSLGPEDLRREPLHAALSGIEKTYGIPRDDFVNALKNGVDPKHIFANAPKNPVAPELLDRIAAGLAQENGAAGLDPAKLAEAMKAQEANTVPGNGAGAGTPMAAAGASRSPASTSEPSLEDLSPPAAGGPSVSPEVKAAMAARAEQAQREKEMKDSHGWSLFQLVSSRYRKIEPMLYGRVEKSNPDPVPQQLRN